jgi:hypothetical protein
MKIKKKLKSKAFKKDKNKLKDPRQFSVITIHMKGYVHQRDIGSSCLPINDNCHIPFLTSLL